MEKYLSDVETNKIIGVHQRTWYQWDKKGWINIIRTPGGKRMYNVEKYLREKNCENNQMYINNSEINMEVSDKLNFSYVRVSSNEQKDDLERQK